MDSAGWWHIWVDEQEVFDSIGCCTPLQLAVWFCLLGELPEQEGKAYRQLSAFYREVKPRLVSFLRKSGYPTHEIGAALSSLQKGGKVYLEEGEVMLKGVMAWRWMDEVVFDLGGYPELERENAYLSSLDGVHPFEGFSVGWYRPTLGVDHRVEAVLREYGES